MVMLISGNVSSMNPYAVEFKPSPSELGKQAVESLPEAIKDCAPPGLSVRSTIEPIVHVSPFASEFLPAACGFRGSSTTPLERLDLSVSEGLEVTVEEFRACSPFVPMKLLEPTWVKDLQAAPGRFQDGGARVVSGCLGQAALDASRLLARATDSPAWATQEAWLRWRAARDAAVSSEAPTTRGGSSGSSSGRSATDEPEVDWQDSDTSPGRETSEDERSVGTP